MNHCYSFSMVSRNSKTGPIPVTMTSMDSCPSTCAFKGQGCYAETGLITIHWRKLSDPNKGISFEDLLTNIKSIRENTLWRHNTAGDLPNYNGEIHGGMLSLIVEANKGKRGFTYTHISMQSENNQFQVKMANFHGFAVNLSANSPMHADELYDLAIGPVVCAVTQDTPKVSYTPKGRTIVICPAVLQDINCKDCGVCQKINRKVIIGFPVHGSCKAKAETVVKFYSKG